MLLKAPGKPRERLVEERKPFPARALQCLAEWLGLDERDPEMARVHLRGGIDLPRSEMADELIAEEHEGDAVLVPPGFAAPESARVKSRRLLEVAARDSEMKNMASQPFQSLTGRWLALGASRHPDKPLFDGKRRRVSYASFLAEVLDESSRFMEESGTVVVSERDFVSSARSLLAAWEAGRKVALLSPTLPGGDRSVLLERLARARPPSGTGLLLFTSGTTGLPKAVCLSTEGVCRNAELAAEATGLSSGDRLCVAAPFHFTSGLCHFLSALSVGATIVDHSGFATGEGLARLLEETACTAFGGAPTHLVRVVATVSREAFPGRMRIWMSSGDRLPEVVRREATARYPGLSVVVMYGLTEVGGRLCVSAAPDDKRMGSVGKPLPGMQVTIRDADGAELPRGSTGEIWASGPLVMLGYLGEVPPSPLGHRTGDFGLVDETGALWIEGRRDDLFKCGGERVSALRTRDAILAGGLCVDAVVLAVPDSLLGHVPVAFVVPKGAWDRAEARRRLRGTVPDSHLPLAWYPVGEIPRTASGKPVREALLREIRRSEEEAR